MDKHITLDDFEDSLLDDVLSGDKDAAAPASWNAASETEAAWEAFDSEPIVAQDIEKLVAQEEAALDAQPTEVMAPVAPAQVPYDPSADFEPVNDPYDPNADFEPIIPAESDTTAIVKTGKGKHSIKKTGKHSAPTAKHSKEREPVDVKEWFREHRKGLIAAVATVGTVAAVYAGGVVTFNHIFLPNTTINGQDVSLRPISYADQVLAAQTQDYRLAIQERGYEGDDIPIIEGKEVKRDGVAQIVAKKVNAEKFEEGVWEFQGIDAPKTANIGETVEFSAIIKGDKNGLSYNYAWSWEGKWGDDWNSTKKATGTMTTATSSSFTPTKEGYYYLWVDIQDSKGEELTSKRVWVKVSKPLGPGEWKIADVSAPSEAYVGEELEYSVVIEGDTTSLTYNYAWSWEGQWGEDWSSTIKETGEMTSATSSTFTPLKAGTYYLWVDVKGANGKSDTSDTVEVYVEFPPEEGIEAAGPRHVEYITGEQVGMEYVHDYKVDNLLKNQPAWMWPASFFQKYEHAVAPTVNIDEAKLREAVDGLKATDVSRMEQPENAFIDFDWDTDQYYIADEKPGTVLSPGELRSYVHAAMCDFKPAINLEQLDIYTHPQVEAASPEILEEVDRYNRLCPFILILDLGDGVVERLDATTFINWVDEYGNVDKNAIHDYVYSLSDRYDTVGTKRTFTSVDGNTYTVSGGTYGWNLNNTKEIEEITKMFETKQSQNREAYWHSKGVSHSEADWGDDYIELNLSTQHMRRIRNGEVIFEADVVTGRPTPQRITPDGVWSILEIQRNRTLRGDRRADGSYEYETPVAYWMRVTWTGVGFHDATWQPWFGGNRYTYAGSHGCINMSYGDAQTLFGMVYLGLPVVIHY
ncbi:MAG: L,D-transpeptidase family protein [Coriobacteriales bacterium]|nr:L,D-transpeptidase family protein [Coriobacteriales bacterium]